MSKYTLISLTVVVFLNIVVAKNYYIKTSCKVNWFAAVEACNSQGLELATVNSPQEEQDLEKAIKASKASSDYVWISTSDLSSSTPNSYVWLSSGEPCTYTNWDVNQPDNFRDKENCAHVWPSSNSGRQYAWNDNVCSTPMYYACQDKVCHRGNNNNNIDARLKYSGCDHGYSDNYNNNGGYGNNLRYADLVEALLKS